jgi:hypothetical protein
MKKDWLIVGAIIFFIGIVLIGLAITVMPSKPLLMSGIIIAGGGFALRLGIK